jgi:hypothetical protein
MNNESLLKIIRLSEKFKSESLSGNPSFLEFYPIKDLELYPIKDLELSYDKVLNAVVTTLRELGVPKRQILEMLRDKKYINKLINLINKETPLEWQ